MIGILIIGWILTWFQLDNILIDAINQILNTNFTTAIYWLIFFIIGLFVMIIKKIKKVSDKTISFNIENK